MIPHASGFGDVVKHRVRCSNMKTVNAYLRQSSKISAARC